MTLSDISNCKKTQIEYTLMIDSDFCKEKQQQKI